VSDVAASEKFSRRTGPVMGIRAALAGCVALAGLPPRPTCVPHGDHTFRDDGGSDMKNIPRPLHLLLAVGLLFGATGAGAQSFRVQCPISTAQHPGGANPDGSTIKCQQIAGGDGYATMGDGTTTYLFGFGPLSGLPSIYNGQPGTKTFTDFNTTYGPVSGTPSALVGMPDGNFSFQGAIGLTDDYSLDPWASGQIYLKGATVRVMGANPNETGSIYTATSDGTSGGTPLAGMTGTGPDGTIFDGGVYWAYQGSLLDGHVDPRPIMDVGVMNANQPAPLIAIDEDDELFLTLTNVGMIMRPDLFEQHTVHFHGYPNASAFYDGVPDASIAINVGGSFTYYYLAPDAGTYFWHCHIAPPEHLQMGMVGQLYVRPRQNKISSTSPGGGNLQAFLVSLEAPPVSPAAPTKAEYENLRKRCGGDILCSTPVPPANSATNDGTRKYAYNDGDGSTRYDVEYPIQIHGFDPNFHFVGMTFNPESFNEMKDKYFLLNGRSYPDTVGGHVCATGDTLPACSGSQAVTVGGVKVAPGPMETQSSDGTSHASQPLPTVINIPVGGRALLRISDLDVSEYQTLASLGIPMKVVGLNARLLRDMAGNNMAYQTNSVTLAGGESIDVILDATGYQAGQKFYLYTPNLDHLSNDAENFGGLMTEINICGSVNADTKVCGT
jgi:FtsP/CotA-like multicopper oxidase with cupredoxin domain